MKIKFIKLFNFLLLNLGFSFVAFAQSPCVFEIPEKAESIAKNPFFEKVGKNKAYWLCNNVFVSFRGGNSTLFVESGVKLIVANGNYLIYLKKNASLEIRASSNCIVYHEIGSFINESGSTKPARYYPCENLVFDYSTAPASSCPKEEEAIVAVVDTVSHNPLDVNNPDIVVLNPEDTLKNPQIIGSHIIPEKAVLVKPNPSRGVLYGNNQVYWLCNYANLQFHGSNNIFYVESSANLQIANGNENIIYLKFGSSLSLDTGKANKVFYQEGATLLQDRSTTTRFTKLQQMDFDYSKTVQKCD